MQNVTRFSKKTTLTILVMAPILGLALAYVLTLSPSELEVKALNILDNQKAWWTEQEKIADYDAQIDALEVLKDASLQAQASLSAENNDLRSAIDNKLAGF